MISQCQTLRNTVFKFRFARLAALCFSWCWLFGCATPSNVVSLKKITPQQRFYVGRVHVVMNGQPADRCEVYLNNDIAPSLQLAKDGFVVLKTDRENVRIKKLACRRIMGPSLEAWHLHKLPFSPVARPLEAEKVQYIGDINVNWTVDDDAAKILVQQSLETESRMKLARIEPSGDIKVDVVSDLKAAEQAWQHLQQSEPTSEKSWTVVESLVKLSQD